MILVILSGLISYAQVIEGEKGPAPSIADINRSVNIITEEPKKHMKVKINNFLNIFHWKKYYGVCLFGI